MQINSRVFGQIEVDDDKIITFENGIVGFDEYHRYALAFDSEKADNSGIMWLQSVEETTLAFPVINPMVLMEDYNPIVEDEWLKDIGPFKEDSELFVMCIMVVPSDLTKMTANLKAPLIINTTTKKACQIIVNNDYDVHFNVYDYLQKMKEGRTC